jgi:UPF0755 protein
MASKAGKVVFLLAFFGLAAAMAAGAALFIYRNQLIYFSKTPMKDDPASVTVEIAKGSNPRQIAKLLEEKGVIFDDEAFYRWLHYIAKKDGTLKAGTYTLNPKMTPEEIVAVLQTGRQPEIRFTIPEGLRKEEVAAIIADAGFGTKASVLAAMASPATLAAFGIPSGVPGGVDGYLFPDTYQFPKDTAPDVILKKLRASTKSSTRA